MAATEQFNIRVPPRVKERFRARAEREGMTQAQLLEALLRQRGKLPAPEPQPEPETAQSPAPAPASGPEVNFVTWLAGRQGMPRALVARAVAAGRVTVAGVPWTAEGIPANMLEHAVQYDGTTV